MEIEKPTEPSHAADPPSASNQFRLLVESVVDYAIFILDPDGRVITWSLGAERIKGYSASEIIGKHFSIFYPEEDIRRGKPKWELEIAQSEGRFEDEGWRVRKDGSRFWANVIITALRDRNRHLVGFGKVTRDFTERRRHQEELEESEERFRLLVEGVPDYAIFMMNADGKITTWNLGAQRIKGYAASEIIGRDYSTFFPEEDARAGKPRKILDAAVQNGRSVQEGWRVRKDGSRFWVNAVVTALRNKNGQLIGFSKITRDVTEKMKQDEALQNEVIQKRKAQEELVTSEQSLRQLSLSLLRTQDEERKRIGREMHDSLGQYLSALKMKLDIMRVKEAKTSPKLCEELDRCSSLLDECVTEVRTISYLLYPPMLEEMGLKSAVSWYLEGFTQRSGIKSNLEVPADLKRVSRDIELALFRVLQESLTNVHKHSSALKVDIRLSSNNGNIELSVRDYGKGLPESVLSQTSHRLGVGLRGMAERMRQLGGTLAVENAQPGALVTASVPATEGNVDQTPD